GIAVDRLAPDEGQHRCDVPYRIAGNREIVIGKNGKVCELSGFDLSFLSDLRGKPSVRISPEPKGCFAIELIAGRIELQAAKGAAGYQPRERDPGVIRRNARRIGACTDGHAHLQHPPNRWGAFSLLSTIACNKVLALISHAMLNGDATAKLGNPFDV